MFASSGWAVADRKFNELITELSDINRIDPEAGDVAQQVRDRINTVAAMKAWRADLQGMVNNLQLLNAPPTRSNLVERQ